MPERSAQQPEGFCNLDYLVVHLGRNETTAMHLVDLFLEHYPVLAQRMLAALEARLVTRNLCLSLRLREKQVVGELKHGRRKQKC